MNTTIIAAATTALLTLTACKSAQERKLEATAALAEQHLRALSAKKSVVQRVAMGGVIEAGGNAVDYLVAGLPENAPDTLVPIAYDPAPWTVVVRQDGETHEFIIESFGADAHAPLRSTRVPAPR